MSYELSAINAAIRLGDIRVPPTGAVCSWLHAAQDSRFVVLSSGASLFRWQWLDFFCDGSPGQVTASKTTRDGSWSLVPYRVWSLPSGAPPFDEWLGPQ